MKQSYLFLASALVLLSGFVSAGTHSLFTSTSSSTGNSFTTAPTFPATSPVILSPTPTPAPGDVIINEINWEGSNGDSDDEWIELKNTSSNPINLTNWTIEGLGSGSSSITLPTATIPANSFFLISHFDKLTSKINVDPDFITTTISLVNTGEILTLKNNSSVVIDTANHAGTWYTGTNTVPKKSMERKVIPGDGTVITNWMNATTHTNMDGATPSAEFGTPKAENGL